MILPSYSLRGISGIYCAIHRDSLMCYVGSSVNIHRRRIEHLHASKTKCLTNFHRALREFGADSFDFELLEICSKENMLEREEFWIKFLGAASLDGFNTSKTPTATYNRQVSEVSRKRHSAGNRGKKRTPERIEQMRQIHLGTKHSAEHIEKIRAKMKVRVFTEEHRARLSASQKGRTFSEETREKMRQAALGRKLSKGHKVKIAESLKGHVVSEETREKLRKKKLGTKQSPATIEKMRQANLGKKLSAEHIEKREAARKRNREASK